MLQGVFSVFVVYRRKTLTGSPDPMHANGMNKPWILTNVASTALHFKEVIDRYSLLKI